MNSGASATSDRFGNPWHAAHRWLARAPIDDPVDRRNAPMLQIVLLMLGVLPPLAWAYRLSADIPWRPGETLSLALSLSLSALALFSVFLIRRGRLQWAVRQLMLVVAAILMLSYFGNGFDANRFEHPVQVMWLVITGLMIGRKALWLMYGWIVAAFAVGVWRDVRAGVEAAVSPADLGVDALISAVIFLFIAVVIDRSVSALRESLRDAIRRSAELAEANRLLQAEIAERERVQAQLIHARKVEAVGTLAGGVVHDFNHLLGLIQGYAERGMRDPGDREAVARVLDGVMSAARRAEAISRKLLNFSRLDVAKPETFDARDALREMQPMLRQLFDPAIAIEPVLPERPQPIRFDRAQFDLMILNIAANASQAMPDGGRFGVALRPGSDPANVAIELRDTGHGMDEAVKQRIFEPFFTTKPAGQGTGLGLAVVHDLVSDAGGAISVDSNVGAGTTVWIELPLQASAAR